MEVLEKLRNVVAKEWYLFNNKIAVNFVVVDFSYPSIHSRYQHFLLTITLTDIYAHLQFED
jgi:hypothetical protein